MPPVWLLAKENHHLLGPKLVASWLNYLPPSVGPQGFRWQSKRIESSAIMTLTVSNVPGPRERETIGGATIAEIYSVGPLAAGSGMNITVWSYPFVSRDAQSRKFLRRPHRHG
ncbi:MAG: diacylglycerol O-acyltransferase / wax synthase [Mycobacterium sp.]|jgi:hypothetical protein|nr:diacylglycerol O-acyltransferase / wax synthase [Mycobacterium sp.]